MISANIASKTGRLVSLAATGLLALTATATETPTEERFIPNYAAGDAYYIWATRTDLESVPGASLQVQGAGIKAPVSLFNNEDTRITAGLHFRWNELNFDGSPVLDESVDVYRVQLPLDFWHSFNERWKAWGRLEPGLFSDFENVNEDAFAVTVLALASYQITPKFSTAFGVYYSRDLGEDRVLPALGFIWKPNAHWNLGLTFPRASIAYAPTADWLFTAYAAPGGAGWSINDTATGERRRLNYKCWRVGISTEHSIATVGPATLWVFATGGWQVGQELEVENNAGTLLKTDLEHGQFISGGVRLRF